MQIAALGSGLGLALGAALLVGDGDEEKHRTGFDLIDEADIRANVLQLCSAPLEGRDSPSVGLDRAADFLVEQFEELGLETPKGWESMRQPFVHGNLMPDEGRCALELAVEEGEERPPFEVNTDFAPVPYCGGEASGPLVFAGFGISERSEKWDDLRGLELEGAVAVIIEGEPRHKRRFDGPELSESADLFRKLGGLYDEKVVGVVVVKRPPETEGVEDDDVLPDPATASFEHSFASWLGSPRVPATVPLPVVEVTPAVASVLLGTEIAEVIAEMEKRGKPVEVETEGRSLTVASAVRQGGGTCNNVAAFLPGGDPELAGEVLIVGAHYDHIGVDPRGRIGFGADDNASGTSAMLEVAEAFVAAQPRRSILFCAFAAEEDGLVGSKYLARNLPVPKSEVVAMINMDMLGRGKASEVAVLGIKQNPELERVLDRAKRLEPTGVKKIVVRKGEELFQRSDHYSFHEVGIPVLFFFEGLPISKNKDYHTWRDSFDKLDLDKITRSTRLVFSTAWLIANDDERPPEPGA